MPGATTVGIVCKDGVVLAAERRSFPYLTQTIGGGIDETGPKLFVLDPLGSVIEDKFTAVGSGSEIAMGLLETDYKEGMSVEEGKGLVRKAVKAATARDIGSGEGLDMLIITNSGVKEENEPIAK